MKKNLIFKTTVLTILSSSVVIASGWKIPAQSASSAALSGAYIANANGADTAYFNPANISFNSNINQAEISAMYIGLTSVDYRDNRTITYDGHSKEEQFIIPTVFITTRDYKNNGVRYGFSITAPAGLTKRWDDPFAKTFAQEFSLKIIELNPVVSYRVNSNFSIGAGLRVVYSNGVVKSDGYIDVDKDGIPDTRVSRDMDGNTIEYGYNLALTYKPNDISNLSATYRSNISLNEKGDAKLYYNGIESYSGSASVSVPLPAVLAIAYSYKFTKTTVEFEYDKTYWSKYKTLNFEYGSTVTNPVLDAVFDAPIDKNWKDSNSYRIGVTHQYNDKLTLMAGFAIEKSPIPIKTVGFELPGSDAKLYSIGANYKFDNRNSIGFGYIYT